MPEGSVHSTVIPYELQINNKRSGGGERRNEPVTLLELSFGEQSILCNPQDRIESRLCYRKGWINNPAPWKLM